MTNLKIILLVLILSVPGVLHATEDDLYDFLWLDPDKKVYVLQNKVYRKEKNFYANLGFIRGMSNEFQSTIGFQLTTGYYFTEEWAVELMYNHYNNSNNEAYTNIQTINQSVPFVRRINQSYGALAVWSPFYGKINTFNRIFYFDWSFGLGLGQVKAESNAETVTSPTQSNSFKGESYGAALGKTGLRFHLTKHFHIDLQYLNTMYKAPGPKFDDRPQTDKLRFNSDVILSVGFSF